MRTNEFIIEELKKHFCKEINNFLIDGDKKIINFYINEIFSEKSSNDLELLLINLKRFDKIVELKKTNEIIDLLINVKENPLNKNILNIIEQKINSNPLNKIYPLIWIYYKVSFLENEEYLDINYANFLKTITDKFGYVFDLDDFLYLSRLLLIKPIWQLWEKDIFYNIFLSLVTRYPQKYEFNRILSYIYFKNSDYELALKSLKEITSVKKISKILSVDFTYFDYLDACQLSGITYFKIGEVDKAKYYFNFVVSNLQKNKKSEFVEIQDFAESLLFRIRLNIEDNNTENVLQDYLIVKSYIYGGELEYEFSDVLNYINGRVK